MKLLIAVAALVAVLAGCAGPNLKEAFVLSSRSLQDRQVESRRFDGIDEVQLLAACAGVLQDIGFQSEESESKLGLLVASKESSAIDYGQVARSILLAVLVTGDPVWDKKQKIRASLIVSDVREQSAKGHIVRVTFQRIVWDNKNKVSKQEWLGDPALYQEFYQRLSKAVFLEAQKI